MPDALKETLRDQPHGRRISQVGRRGERLRRDERRWLMG